MIASAHTSNWRKTCALKQNSTLWSSKLSLWAYWTPFLMFKHTPKLLVSKATTLPTKLGGSKKRWQINKIKLTWEMKTVFHCKEWWAAYLLYYSQVYLRSLPIQLMEQQNSFSEWTWMLSGNECCGTFCTLRYYLIPKKVPNELMSQNWLCGGWVPLRWMITSDGQIFHIWYFEVADAVISKPNIN